MPVAEMLRTHPSPTPTAAALADVIGALTECAQACTSCADACLGEETVQELVRCIRLNLDCADVCETTGRVLTRQTAFDAQLARQMLETCAQACRVCGDECERHAEHHEHCRVCAEACRRCEQACNDVVSTIG